MARPGVATLRAGLAVLFLSTGAIAMAASSKRLGADVSGVRVTMNIYSGRPDPVWTIEGARLDELLQRLDALPVAGGESGGGPSLGYRGLTLEFSGAGEGDVSGGRVTLPGGGALVDAGRGFERWLVETGAAAVDPKAIETALQRIGPAR